MNDSKLPSKICDRKTFRSYSNHIKLGLVIKQQNQMTKNLGLTVYGLVTITSGKGCLEEKVKTNEPFFGIIFCFSLTY